MLLFSDVAEVFAEIEKRSGRLEMTDVLSALFKRTDSTEIGRLVYMIQGILAPPYEGIDLGLGEKFGIEAIAASSGYTRNQVEADYRKSGDLGDTAQDLAGKKKQTALSTSEMGIAYVFEAMIRIAKSSGQGSQDQKIKILAELLNNSSPLEARYIIRFVTGNMRLGVGDPTILDALSVAKTGDKSLRDPLERAYDVCADMGRVAKMFYERSGDISSFKVEPFRPLMPALAERENSSSAIIERLGRCGVEMKYDGFRLQCHKNGKSIEVYSRKLEKMTAMFPDVVEEIRRLGAESIIFEGEALAYDAKKKKYFPFQETMHRRRKHGISAASEEYPLNLFVFDVLFINGKDMTNEPYKARRELVERTFKGKILKPSQMKIISKAKELDSIFKESLSEGLEGIIAKDLSAPYTAGKRKFAWIKLKKSYGKSVDTIDGVIIGYYLGQGSRAEFEFGGLLVAVYNPERGRLETVARIGTGFSEEEMKELQEMLSGMKTKQPAPSLDFKVVPDYWVEPKYVAEIAFDDITESKMHTCAMRGEKGLALRFPRLVKMRPDKTVKEATTTQEVEDMFKLQREKG